MRNITRKGAQKFLIRTTILFFAVCAVICSSPLFSQEQFEDSGYFEDDDGLFFEDDEGITVTGTRETTQQIIVIEKETIEKSGVADLGELLQETAGIGVTRYGPYGNQGGMNLRGFDIKRIAVLIDGAPVTVSNDGKFDMYQMSPESIERIEVIYGGSDSKYNVSGALGGVINIVTVKKQKPGLRLGAGVSNLSSMPGKYWDKNSKKAGPEWEDLFDTQRFYVSSAWGGKTVSVSANVFANRVQNHFLYLDSLEFVRRKEGNEVWDAGASVSLVKELPDMTKLISSSSGYYGNRHLPTSGSSAVFGIQRDSSFRQNFMLDMPRAFHDDLATEASLTYNMGLRDYEPPTGAMSRHNQHGFAAINRWSWFPLQWLTLRSGVDWRFAWLDSTDMGRRVRHDGGLYLTGEFAPHKSLLVIPSIKAVTDGHSVVPVPKLGFLWNATDFLTLKNNYFRSFKFPDFEELYWGGGGGTGNPDLRPEDGWGGDLGAVFRYQKLARLESTFFTQWTNNSIHWYPDAGAEWQPENVGAAIFFGLDSRIRFDIPVSWGPVKKLVPSVLYQYMLSYLLSYGYTWESEQRIPYMPAHTISGSLEAQWETGSASISCHYESLRYAEVANLTELPPVFLLNVSADQKIGKMVNTFAVLRNILNKSYVSFTDYPMPGITLTLGMRFTIDTGKGD